MTTKIEAGNGGTIGCKSYVMIGFDAKVDKIVSTFWPIKAVTELDNQLVACENGNSGCNGFFWKLEFDNDQKGFTGAATQQLQFEMMFTGGVQRTVQTTIETILGL